MECIVLPTAVGSYSYMVTAAFEKNYRPGIYLPDASILCTALGGDPRIIFFSLDLYIIIIFNRSTMNAKCLQALQFRFTKAKVFSTLPTNFAKHMCNQNKNISFFLYIFSLRTFLVYRHYIKIFFHKMDIFKKICVVYVLNPFYRSFLLLIF